jgi:hypothetical protein
MRIDSPSPLAPIEVSEGEFLALSHLDEKPVRDVGEVNMLSQSFVQTIVRSSGSNAVIVGAPEVATASIEVGFETTDSEAGTDVSPSELPFYRYTTQDTAANKTGIMIASGDKRLGGVLAYIEDDADNPDPSSGAFMEMLASNLAAYTLTLVDEYNSISEEDIEAAQQIANGTKSSSKSASLRSVSRNVEIDHSENSFLPLIETKWGQEKGYWRVLNLVKGAAEYNLGSAPVAMGQLMAYYEWPAKSSLASKKIQHPFDVNMNAINLSEIVYDWALMKAFPMATDSGMSNEGKLGINTLLYEAGVTTGTTHGRRRDGEVTTTPIGNVIGAFAQMGYDVSQSGLRPYDYKTIQTSIDKRQPVIVSAAEFQHDHVTTATWTTTEYYVNIWFIHLFSYEEDHSSTSYSTTYSKDHTWIIDDYEEREYQDPIRTSFGVDATLSRTAKFVHCNFGENGISNGWYVSKIFSPSYEGPVDDVQRSVSGGPVVQRSTSTTTTTSGNGDYYQYNMQIIPYLMPKK